MRGATSVALENVGRFVHRRTLLLRSDSFFQAGFAQLSQETAISTRIRSTDSKGLPRKLGQNMERKSFFVSAGEGAE